MKSLFPLLFFELFSTTLFAQDQPESESHTPVTIRLVCYNRAAVGQVSYFFRHANQEKFIPYNDQVKKKEFSTIFSPEDIEKVSVSKGAEADEKFGEFGDRGVIIIDLKSEIDSKTWRKIKRY